MEFRIADKINPCMGLNNKICNAPKYWCRLHQVWLSEKDVQRKRCDNRLTYDMIGFAKCTNLEKRNYKDWLNNLEARNKK